MGQRGEKMKTKKTINYGGVVFKMNRGKSEIWVGKKKNLDWDLRRSMEKMWLLMGERRLLSTVTTKFSLL